MLLCSCIIAVITHYQQFIDAKSSKLQTQMHIQKVRDLWAEFQHPLFKVSGTTTTLPTLSLTSGAYSASAVPGDANGLVNTLGRWRELMDAIDERVCNGNLADALISIPSFMREMQLWESEFSTATPQYSYEGWLTRPRQLHIENTHIRVSTAYITR